MELPKSGLLSTVFSALLRPYICWLDRPSLPHYNGDITLAGLKHPVTVNWNAQAIPHVTAADETDLFFAQGFLHAQERLWQMEINRRFLSGRMAEIFGDFALPWKDLSAQFRGRSSVDFDCFIRMLGIRAAARAALAAASEQDRIRLEAYCAGVNRYIDSCRKPPWEFRLLRVTPEPWLSEDILTIGKGLAFLLSTALYTRLNFIAVAHRLKEQPEKLRALFPTYPDSGATISRAAWDQTNGLWRFASGVVASGAWHPAGTGSNSWAVASTRSNTGGVILCNDPHLRMTLPAVWYLMRLQVAPSSADTESYDAWGATIPGCPLVQLGRNRSIAWGITAAVCDDVELYREKLHPLQPELYQVGAHWQTLDHRPETIGVRRGQSRKISIRSSRHGPVISDFTETGKSSEILSLRWTAHEPGQDLRALYELNRARNWQEFRQSLSHHSAPTLNFTYADDAGNIGYALAGRIPRRTATPTLLPLQGWDEKNDWLGYIPFDEMPRVYNPPEGFIATANNRVTDQPYPYYLSHFFEPPHRARRIQDLLKGSDRLSLADMAALQLDDTSLHARELVATLKTDLAGISDTDLMLRKAVERLLSWDGRCSAASVEATIFHVFHHRLLLNLLTPALGEDLYSAYIEILNQCIVPTDAILSNPSSVWFAARPRSELVAISFREACTEIFETLGPDMNTWCWGRIHRLRMNHALGRLPVLRSLLEIGPLPTAGDGTSINLGFYRHSNPYTQTVGASVRFIADLSDPHRAEMILASGQSGHPLSSHYGDQTNFWLRGDRLSLPDNGPDKTFNRQSLLLKPD